MMLWILLGILVVSIIVAVVIVARHLNELRILNVEAMPETREKQIKKSILAERLSRIGRERTAMIKQKLTPLHEILKKVGQNFHARVHELEISYEHAKRLALGTRGKRTAQIMGLLREAQEFERKGENEEAERKYIAVVSLDPRNVDAYEGLGNLYLKMRKYQEARESLTFIKKFRPNDASVTVSLGEVALAEGKPEEAMPFFAQAIELKPGNPKYLDFYIESAILAGSKKEAERGLKLMRESNPENQKITEWEKKIEEM